MPCHPIAAYYFNYFLSQLTTTEQQLPSSVGKMFDYSNQHLLFRAEYSMDIEYFQMFGLLIGFNYLYTVSSVLQMVK
jgi:hypothetical protein